MRYFIAAFFIVMAILGIIMLVENPSPNEPTSVLDAFYPQPTGFVVDDAGILSPATEAKLTADLTAFKGTAEIAVLTVKTTSPLDMPAYAIKLAEQWKVGDAEKDNGVIFIIASEDRQVRIEVGSGAEAYITDSQAGAILDNAVVPHLKQGDWDGGVLAGVEAIKARLK